MREDNLGEELSSCSNHIQGPWAVMGDFNIIFGAKEKFGGRPYYLSKSLDFINYLDDCGLQDDGYYRAKYTWYDNRGPTKIIWKKTRETSHQFRMDRCTK